MKEANKQLDFLQEEIDKQRNIKNGKSDCQIAWAAKIVLEAMCKRIKRNQENGILTMADGYIASLLAEKKEGRIDGN